MVEKIEISVETDAMLLAPAAPPPLRLATDLVDKDVGADDAATKQLPLNCSEGLLLLSSPPLLLTAQSAPSPNSLTKKASTAPCLRENSQAAGVEEGRSNKGERHIRFASVACLLDAAVEGDLVEVKRLIEGQKVHPDCCNADGVTALHCAAGTGHLDLMRYLLTRGASVNVPDEHGWTPLHSAAYNNHRDIAQLLLEHNADVEAEDSQAVAPLGLPTDPELVQALTQVSERKHSATVVTAMYDLNGQSVENGQGEELSFSRGDALTILNRDDPNWWLAEHNGRRGYVPRQFVQ